MRIPYPTRIPLSYTVLFGFVLCAFELLQGTGSFFVGCVFVYLLIITIAFNVAGGLDTPAGGFIFFMALLTVVFGVVMKAVLWEPADATLKRPDLTISAHVGMSISALVAAYLAKRFSRRTGILDNLLTPKNLYHVTVGCLVMSILIPVTVSFIGNGDGSIGSGLQRINQFGQLAVLLGTFHSIRASAGKRSLNMVVILAIAYSFAFGIVQYSKLGILSGIFSWFLIAVALKYDFSFSQLASVALFGAFIFYYMVPFAQAGRVDRESETPYSTALHNLGRLDELRRINGEIEEQEAASKRGYHYFVATSTMLERLQTLAMDDALISVTEDEGTFGYYPILTYYANLVPHFIWADKPNIRFQTRYAHRIGLLAEDDETTGISFSPVAEAWFLGRWNCLMLIVPLMLSLTFIVMNSVTSSVSKAPWGFYFILLSAHLAPEEALSGMVSVLFLSVVLIITAYISVYFMPLVGALFLPQVNRASSQPLATAPQSQQPSVAS